VSVADVSTSSNYAYATCPTIATDEVRPLLLEHHSNDRIVITDRLLVSSDGVVITDRLLIATEGYRLGMRVVVVKESEYCSSVRGR
jgi:hypothetical protein